MRTSSRTSSRLSWPRAFRSRSFATATLGTYFSYHTCPLSSSCHLRCQGYPTLAFAVDYLDLASSLLCSLGVSSLARVFSSRGILLTCERFSELAKGALDSRARA